MKLKQYRETIVNVVLALSLLILLVIAGVSGLIVESARRAALEAMRQRADMFAARAGAALFPRTDPFALHFLVNTVMLDKTVGSAAVLRQDGLIRSHSDPEKIGDPDEGKESEAARSAKGALMQTFKNTEGREGYYFSSPILVGTRRLGTVVVVSTEDTLDELLGPTRQRLIFIFLAALAAVPVLLQLRYLLRAEQRAAAMKSAMMRTVSHEFNNAITVIDAAVFMLDETEPDKKNPRRAGLYDTLKFETKSLGRYVKNILNEARMESGRFKVEKKEIALRDLVARTVYSMEGLMRQKNVSFRLDITGKPVPVFADPEALSLVVSNLIGNAVKYVPPGGRVLVRLGPDQALPGNVRFYVENSGRGITPDDIKKLKQEFYRTEDAKAAASGFGLGLRISNEMLQLHGSELEVTSEEGKSSAFSFSLPAAKQMVRAAVAAAPVPPAPPAPEKAKNKKQA
jgi:signal transduction histidine kinase